MTVTRRLPQAVSVLFGAYGKADDTDRQKIYCRLLVDVSPELLAAGVERAISTRTFLPSVKELLDDCLSVASRVDPALEVKSWPEAWREIERAVRETYWGRTPKFSTPEIEAAVKSYGWRNIYMSEEREWQIIHAQLRDIYRTICERGRDRRLDGRLAAKYSLTGMAAGEIGEAVRCLAAKMDREGERK